jgi:hypothetical protein
MPRGDEEETSSRPPLTIARLAGSAVGLQDRGRGPPAVGVRPPTSHVSTGHAVATCLPGGLSPPGEGQPRCHGPGAEGAWPAALPARSLAAGALPQPDRLGHLLSRARGDAGWRGRRAQLPIAMGAPREAREGSEDEFAGRAPSRSLSRARELIAGDPACAGFSGPEPMRAARAASCGPSLGPLPPVLRDHDRDPLHPRCLPSMGFEGFVVPGGPSPSARPARSPFPADRPRASAFFVPGIGPPP